MGVAYIAYLALEPWTNTQQFNLLPMQTYTHSDYFFPTIGMIYKYKQIPTSHINPSTEFADLMYPGKHTQQSIFGLISFSFHLS